MRGWATALPSTLFCSSSWPTLAVHDPSWSSNVRTAPFWEDLSHISCQASCLGCHEQRLSLVPHSGPYPLSLSFPCGGRRKCHQPCGPLLLRVGCFPLLGKAPKGRERLADPSGLHWVPALSGQGRGREDRSPTVGGSRPCPGLGAPSPGLSSRLQRRHQAPVWSQEPCTPCS